MRYDLSKLTKKEFETIIKSLPPKFTGLSYFNRSHRHFVDENNIDLYEKKLNFMFDVWGKYQKDKNMATIMASDEQNFWSVQVILFEDHFEIPEYEDEDSAFYFQKTEEQQNEYRQLLDEIFRTKKSRLNQDNNDQSEK